MKNKFNHKNIKNKKILRKVKKNWIIISLSVFSVLSFGGFATNNTIAHADTTDENVHNSSNSGSLKSSKSSYNASSSNSSYPINSTNKSTEISNASSSVASSADTSTETSNSNSSAASSADTSTETSNSSSSAASSTDTSTENSNDSSSAAPSTDTSTETINTSSSITSNVNNSSILSEKKYSYSTSVIDSTQTTDSYSANDGTNIQNINDFDAALAAGDANTKYLKDAPNWVSTIDPMGAAWAPLINQYVKNGNYVVIPQNNINNAESLFNDYVNNYNLSDNYSNFEGSQYNPFYGSDYSIQGVANNPLVQDETGLKNVNPHRNPGSYMYEPTDNLQLAHIVVQTDFGDAGNDNGTSIQAPNSDNQVYVNHQSLESYAGHYEAPIYQIVMKDLSNQVATYPANFIDSNASDDDERQATAAIPLDYMIFLHPQVYDKNGNVVVNDLSQSPIVNINYVYNDSQIVGSQKIFTDNQSLIDENSLNVPNEYTLSNPNDSISISEGQDSIDVPVDKIGSQSTSASQSQGSESGFTPLTSGSGSTPLTSGSGSTPLTSGSGSTSLTSGSGSTPLTSGSGSTPLTSGSGSTSLTSGFGSSNSISSANNSSSSGNSYSYSQSISTSVQSSSSSLTSSAYNNSNNSASNPSNNKTTASSANNIVKHKSHNHHKNSHASMINKRIYNINTIYSYRKPTFHTKGRKEKFRHTRRANRSMFKVIGTTKSHNNKKRYKIIKINSKTNRVMKKTKANIGYVTANKNFVKSLYYSKVKKNQKFRAIRNLYEYRSHNLTGKLKMIRKGKKITIKGINKEGTIYHFKLTNGNYVTANKRYIILNKYYK